MKYQAFDGEVFDTIEACSGYEASQQELLEDIERGEQFLREKHKDSSSRAIAMRRNVLREYYEWHQGANAYNPEDDASPGG